MLGQKSVPQGLKPGILSFTARLKSCPDTKQSFSVACKAVYGGVIYGTAEPVPYPGSSSGTGSRARRFIMGSVCSQRIHGVRLRGAPCGDIAGWYGDENDNEPDGSECQWVGCADVVHKGPQHS
jgi:hypothetical protein